MPQNAHFLYLHDKIWGRGHFALASSTPKSGDLGGGHPPPSRDLRPCTETEFNMSTPLITVTSD